MTATQNILSKQKHIYGIHDWIQTTHGNVSETFFTASARVTYAL